MSSSIVSKVPKNLAFRYRVSCRHFPEQPKGRFELPADYGIPNFGEFEKQRAFADVRIGWAENGIFITANITGKKQSVWCRESQLLESDGLQLWLDTRDTHNLHRATKFCHWILLLPSGGGSGKDKPVFSMLKINRSKEVSPNINKGKVDVAANLKKDGYQLSAFIPSECLYGWNTDDHRNIGFNYAIVDRELGWQTLAIGPEFPIAEDPSLWQTLSLVD